MLIPLRARCSLKNHNLVPLLTPGETDNQSADTSTNDDIVILNVETGGRR